MLKLKHTSLPEVQYLNREIKDNTGTQEQYNEMKGRLYRSLGKFFCSSTLQHIGDFPSGLRNLEAVQENMPFFIEAGYALEQVAHIVAHNGGWQNLLAVKDNHTVLMNLGYSHEQITYMAAFQYGHKTIDSIIKNQEALHVLGPVETYMMAACPSGFKQIERFSTLYHAQKKLGYKDNQIIIAYQNNINLLPEPSYSNNSSLLTDYGFFSKPETDDVMPPSIEKEAVTLTLG
ncbi:hypothetical protein [Legionella saoudiensis]|uniref:hypothetical protein n=1 Tax=Legionella saoudiensis TaxID=1750561 RepID=UPI000730168D|nr:hypothetical protein [Legionella saoudiensis]